MLLWYLASNRDPSASRTPSAFDITREDLDDHQAFGAGGRHFCLGAALARLELRIWIEETLRALAGPAARRRPASACERCSSTSGSPCR